MDNTIFAQSIARIRHNETKLLDSTKIDNLIESKDFNDCIRLLQDTLYSEYVSMPSYEEGLKLALVNLYKEMYDMVPVKEIVDVFRVRYDGHNLKCLIKGKFTGINTDSMIINAGVFKAEDLKVMVAEERFSDLPPVLREYTEKAINDFKSNSDPQSIDLTIDKGTYKYMMEIASKSDLKYPLIFAKLLIDMINIKAFVRIKVQGRGRDLMEKVFLDGGHLDLDMFLNNINDSLDGFANKILHTDHFKWVRGGLEEYIKSGDIGNIEKYGDNFLMDFFKNAKYVSFGPEPLMAFIAAKENEIKIIRIILTGKKNNVSPEHIRERLRDIYV